MRLWWKLSGLLAGLLTAASASAAPMDVAGVSAAGLQRLDAAMQESVDSGQIAGAVTLLVRHGQTVSLRAYGLRSLETGAPMTPDTLFRIRSETKPVTAVAMMILYEEGRWKLDDPISKYIPEFANLRVASGVDAEGRPVLVPADRPPTMRELMTHTAGFAYGLGDDPNSPADRAYFQAGVLQSGSLQEMVDKIAGLPMYAQPGTLWRYSVAGDIQGYLIEKLSGKPLPEFMRERVFAPLGMVDTDFWVPPEKLDRLAQIYDYDWAAHRLAPAVEGPWRDVSRPPPAPSGGGGLVSTASDFSRFARMILNRGELDGVRILSPESVAMIARNQLPEHFSVTSNGIRPFPFGAGIGYGFGVAVAVDPVAAGSPVGPGAISWGGSAGTWFWIDPVNDLVFIGMIQRLGGVGGGLDARSRALVYDALLDRPQPPPKPSPTRTSTGNR